MIATPRGVMIPMPLDYCFALIARLYPRVRAFEVLETAQGLYKLHGALATMVGIVCFSLKVEPLFIGIFIFLTVFTGHWLMLNGYFLPGFPALGRLYSRITGFGIVVLFLTITGFLTVGFWGVFALWVSRLSGEVATILIDRKTSLATTAGDIQVSGKDLILDKYGVLIPEIDRPRQSYSKELKAKFPIDVAACRSFTNAYAIHATLLNLPVEPHVSEDEMKVDSWRQVIVDLWKEWPQVVMRFRLKKEEWNAIFSPVKSSELTPAQWILLQRFLTSVESFESG